MPFASDEGIGNNIVDLFRSRLAALEASDLVVRPDDQQHIARPESVVGSGAGADYFLHCSAHQWVCTPLLDNQYGDLEAIANVQAAKASSHKRRWDGNLDHTRVLDGRDRFSMPIPAQARRHAGGHIAFEDFGAVALDDIFRPDDADKATVFHHGYLTAIVRQPFHHFRQ